MRGLSWQRSAGVGAAQGSRRGWEQPGEGCRRRGEWGRGQEKGAWVRAQTVPRLSELAAIGRSRQATISMPSQPILLMSCPSLDFLTIPSPLLLSLPRSPLSACHSFSLSLCEVHCTLPSLSALVR